MENPVGGMTKILYCGMSNFIMVKGSHYIVVVAGNSTQILRFFTNEKKKRFLF